MNPRTTENGAREESACGNFKLHVFLELRRLYPSSTYKGDCEKEGDRIFIRIHCESARENGYKLKEGEIQTGYKEEGFYHKGSEAKGAWKGEDAPSLQTPISPRLDGL